MNAALAFPLVVRFFAACMAVTAFTLVLVTCFLICPSLSADAARDEPALTFFGWSDQHVKTDGDAKHLLPAIDAMNGLPGTPYPEGIGGKVADPAFVFGCGDITEWPTHAAMKAYDQLITKRLNLPCYGSHQIACWRFPMIIDKDNGTTTRRNGWTSRFADQVSSKPIVTEPVSPDATA